MFRLPRRFASRKVRSPRELALDSLEGRDFPSAERAFSELLAVETVPAERAFLLNKRGVARVAMARPAPARDDFTAALACVPAYAPALTNLGNLLLEEGAVDAAIARYEEAIAADPAYGLAYLNLGAAYKRAGRLNDAVRAIRRAQRLERPSGARGRRPW